MILFEDNAGDEAQEDRFNLLGLWPAFEDSRYQRLFPSSQGQIKGAAQFSGEEIWDPHAQASQNSEGRP